jgi:hypothetical protein
MEIILKYIYKFNLYRKVSVYRLIYVTLFFPPENRTKHMNTPSSQNVEIQNFKPGGA